MTREYPNHRRRINAHHRFITRGADEVLQSRVDFFSTLSAQRLSMAIQTLNGVRRPLSLARDTASDSKTGREGQAVSTTVRLEGKPTAVCSGQCRDEGEATMIGSECGARIVPLWGMRGRSLLRGQLSGPKQQEPPSRPGVSLSRALSAAPRGSQALGYPPTKLREGRWCHERCSLP